jgi:hypothetical protein
VRQFPSSGVFFEMVFYISISGTFSSKAFRRGRDSSKFSEDEGTSFVFAQFSTFALTFTFTMKNG